MGRTGESGPIPIDPRVPGVQARQTVKTILDAVVELLTNSDDSYRRLEKKGQKHDGVIQVIVAKQRLSQFLSVKDNAEGMTLDELLVIALTYGGKTSGFEDAIPVRGLWGRGLKEAILGLGSGRIRSAKNGLECEVEVWWDKASQQARWKVHYDEKPCSASNGTSIVVNIDDSRQIRMPRFDTLYDQVSQHYALRDIVQTRSVWLSRHSLSGQATKKKVKFETREGNAVLNERLDTPFGTSILKVWETPSPLYYARYDPFSLAGIVVKTEGAAIDISLFGCEVEDAARYFFGELWCPGIAQAIREGNDDILTTTRSGLDWRHRDCRQLEATVKEKFEPCVEAKKRSLSSSAPPPIPEEKKTGLLKLLNKIAQEEIEGDEDEGPGPKPAELTKLTIKPDTGYGKPNEPRRFSVYLPKALLLHHASAAVTVHLDIQHGFATLNTNSFALVKNPKWENLLSGSFQVTGRAKGDRAYLECSINNQQDVAEFIVGDRPGKKKQYLGGGTGGFLRDFLFDPTPDPIQRAAYSDGVVHIYLRFPGVPDLLPGSPETPQGKTLFAELILEAFCRFVARRRIDDGRAQSAPGGEIDVFNSEVNRLMKKSMPLVHKWVAEHYG